jgi:hypothetical protein
VRDEVHQQAVVGHVVLQVGVRPVGAPEHAIRELLDDAFRERDHVGVGILLAIQRLGTGDRQPLGTAHLAPDVGVLAHELLEQRELWPVHGQRHIRSAHVVHHDGGGQRREEVPQFGQIHRLEVDHHVPAELGDASSDFHQLVLGREIDQALDEIEAHAAHAGGVQLLQLVVGDAALHRGHTPRLAATGQAGVDHGAVVGAVAGGLHHDVAREPEMVTQRKQLLLAGVARRVLALGRIGKLSARAEDVAVGVHAAGGQFEGGSGGIGVPVEPAGCLGEITAYRFGHGSVER